MAEYSLSKVQRRCPHCGAMHRAFHWFRMCPVCGRRFWIGQGRPFPLLSAILAFASLLAIVWAFGFLVLACGGPPGPASVAGVYDIYSLRGEIRGPDSRLSIELKADGTWVRSSTLQSGEVSVDSGPFSVSEGEDGCALIAFGNAENPNPLPRSSICGDLWSWPASEGDHDTVYKKRE